MFLHFSLYGSRRRKLWLNCNKKQLCCNDSRTPILSRATVWSCIDEAQRKCTFGPSLSTAQVRESTGLR